MSDAAHLNRLRWLCRRGMLELDDWLGCFLERHYSGLGQDEKTAFAKLLEQSDVTLYDWLTGRVPPAPEFSEVVARIKETELKK